MRESEREGERERERERQRETERDRERERSAQWKVTQEVLQQINDDTFDKYMLSVIVRDQGPGISDNDKDKLFKPYSTLPST